MSKEERMARITTNIWRMFAVVVAAALAVNIVQAVAGKADLAWWHLPTLMLAYAEGECRDWIRRLAVAARLLRMRWRGSSARRATRMRGCSEAAM